MTAIINYDKEISTIVQGSTPVNESNIPKLLRSLIYENSLFFAINNQAIAKDFQKYKNYSWVQKFKIGAFTAVGTLLSTHLIEISLLFALRGMSSGKEATCELSMFRVLQCAVLEEILFRGVMQNCLASLQKTAVYVTPQRLQNNCVFKWFTSSAARIISISAIFAAVHLSNGGGYLSEKDSFIQAMAIMLLPVEGILHETTGSIVAPIAHHMTYNFLAKLT